MNRQRPRFCFAVLLVLWQLVAGGFAHAAPVGGAACQHDGAAHEHATPNPEPPAPAHGNACHSPQCGCPCGHTPALRLDVSLDGKVAPPADRPVPVVEALLANPIEEHFRPPN